MIKLHLGCGDQYLQGWTNCDLYSDKADLKIDSKILPYVNNTVDEIYASHLIEHFHFRDSIFTLKEWYRALKPGGKLTLETPDFVELCKEIVNRDHENRIELYIHFFGSPDIPGQAHHFLFTEQQLILCLSSCGFKNINRLKADSIYATTWGLRESLFLKMECEK